MARWNSWNRTAGWLAWMLTGAGKSVNTGFCMRRTHTPVKTGEKPWNMARLTNIGALLAAFGLKQAEQQGEEKRMLTLGIRMNDPILEMNNGEFVWTIGETGSSLKARKPEPDTCGCTENVSIWLETKPEELVSWLFGCRKAEEIWGGQLENKGLAEILAQVDTVNGVYLDEIV